MSKRKPITNARQLTDGTLQLVLPGGDRATVDLITIKLASEEVERKHATGAGWVATAAFMVDLSTAYAPYVPGCTPTMAYQLWEAVLDEWLELKKNTP